MKVNGNQKINVMKRSFWVVLAACVGIFGCQVDEMMESVSVVGEEFHATIENDGLTRTTLDEHNNIRWSANDQIIIFRKTTLGSKYQVKDASVGKTSGSFSLVSSGSSGDDFDAGVDLEHNIAFYPYSESLECERFSSDYKINVNLPSEQTYAPESFGNGTFPMVAVSETNSLTFRNVCGGMKLQLKGTAKIASIKVEGKNGEKLSGNAYVIAYTDDTKPAITMADNASTSVTLDCGAGVQLNESTATEFIISLPPTEFIKGFIITVTDVNGGTQVIETSKSNTVLRSSLLVMPVVTIEIAAMPLGMDYVDEYGVNHGPGVEIDGVIWAPVNCGYHATDFKYGKLYQWGRKYGQGYDGEFYDGDWDQEYSDAVLPEFIYGNGSISIEEGQLEKYANVFFRGGNQDYDWVYPHDGSLWNKGTDESPQKNNNNDPCPQGWRVPTYAEYNAVIAHKSSWTTNENGINGYYFSGSSLYSEYVPQIFLPAAGSRVYYDEACGYNRGSGGRYWSSRAGGKSDNLAYYIYIDRYDAYWDLYDRALGYSVRCVQESSQVSVHSTIDLSAEGTANCYIVSEPGAYKFTPTRGNGNRPVGAIASAEALWETFGTDVTPDVGDLVKNVKYENGVISFETPSAYKEGNAVIAAKDANGIILWSWHIWLTDQPEGQVYYNDAGTFMDRNLGATSATPGDVGALGLLYQWGRKDPFLGSSSIHNDSMAEAKSTITWPATVPSDSSNGTIGYSISHPTTFITYNSANFDWYYTGIDTTDDTRWTESGSTKPIYDPCPAGWRVPDGGPDGVWLKASTSNEGCQGDTANKGINFSGIFGSTSTIWYPASGGRYYSDGSFFGVGDRGYYWTSTPWFSGSNAFYMNIDCYGVFNLSIGRIRTIAQSVRCIKE